jgi:hypothetical protein
VEEKVEKEVDRRKQEQQNRGKTMRKMKEVEAVVAGTGTLTEGLKEARSSPQGRCADGEREEG